MRLGSTLQVQLQGTLLRGPHVRPARVLPSRCDLPGGAGLG